MKKLSTNAKCLSVDVIIHIIFGILTPLLAISSNKKDSTGWAGVGVFLIALIAYAIYYVSYMFGCFSKNENQLLRFSFRLIVWSVLALGMPIGIYFVAAQAIFTAIGQILFLADKEKRAERKKDIIVLITALILSAITAILSVCFKKFLYSHILIFALTSFFVGFCYGIFSFVMLKKMGAWLYGLLIVNPLCAASYIGTISGVLISKICFIIINSTKKGKDAIL